MSAIQASLRSRLSPLDVERIRADFPILKLKVGGKPLIYLDNAASSQMPQQVIDRLVRYQTTQHANIHRAVHYLSETATHEYEEARRKLARFINASEDREVIFTSGTTDAINLVAHGYGRKFIGAGDEIILTTLEHHSNIVPWQMLCEEKGAMIRVVPINDAGELRVDAYEKLFNERTKFVAVMHVSNALGTINPVKHMIAFAHARGVPVLIDGAQAAPHMPVDVQDLDCDFYAFTGHKTYGPTGIGVLYAKKKHLEAMPPYQGGGDMIESVHTDRVVYGKPPHKFEAGTPPIVQAIGLGAALDYMMQVGRERIAAHEAELKEYAHARLRELNWLKIHGTAKDKGAIVAFSIDGQEALASGTHALYRWEGKRWREARTPAGSAPARALVLGGEPGRIYLVGWAGLHRSDDGGRSWTRVGQAIGADPVSALVASPVRPDELRALAAGRVWHSIDGARHWRVDDHAPARVEALAFDRSQPTRLWLVAAGRVHRLDDRAAQWESVGQALPDAQAKPRALQVSGEAHGEVQRIAAMAARADGRIIRPRPEPDGELTPLQAAFRETHALQCGFCTPGILMAAAELLEAGAAPTRAEITDLLSGHLCRCTGYERIVEAIARAAGTAAE
jgi:cysteine desulfurase/selenocysteine lyase